ncbi:MAG: NAD+ synthase [Dethiobacter sp.]|nr:NAD+ synthase [Dethiobacter sp.]
MKIALVQMNPTVGALKKNSSKVKASYRTAKAAGARLVICPELAITGYPPQDLLLYQGFRQQVEAIVSEELAPLTAGGPVLLLGAPFTVDGKLYNSAVQMEEGQIRALHGKTLLPCYDVFDETRYFHRAPRREIVEIDGMTAAVTVCEDMWNDRDLYSPPPYDLDPLEDLFGQGQFDLIINLSASPYHYGKQTLREKVAGYLAKKYRSALLYVNQVGGNDDLLFDGASLIFNNRGELICRGASFEEDLMIIGSETLLCRETSPLPPVEEGIGMIHRALVMGIRDYLSKTGFSRAVLGLSGGIDSALTAALAVEALGPENVLGVLMPSFYSSEHSVADALALAENLGIKTRLISINSPFSAYLSLFNREGPSLQDPAEENLQARIRGNILMFISNREGCLALTTGNKSELAAGYCTLYGDMAGGLAVLADLPKLMIYELAEYLNGGGREIIPRRTIAKPPSAELRPNQKDEDSLPPYNELDPILHLYIEENMSFQEIVRRGFGDETVRRVISLIDRSEYKRRQAAPGLRVTTRAFGSGRRMPIARDYEYQ